jgi:sugar phosphate isomerase/epimerase
MKMAVLTAAVQEGDIPRQEFVDDPKSAAMKATLRWIQIARRLGVGLQLSAALPRPDAYLPPEAMLDPVAPHLPVRTTKDGEGEDLSDESARVIIAACDDDVQIYDLGFFENLLHSDPVIRKQIHAHTLRCARAAKKLVPVGCGGVTGFIGCDPNLDLDQNVALFEREVVPILKQFKEMGLTFWLEQCPMPGWNTTDNYFNNIGYCAGMWIKLIRIAEKHGVGDVLRITYDESHDILMGNTHHGSFAAMAAAGLGRAVNRFHGKNQYQNAAQIAVWAIHGQKIDLGCRVDGQPHPDPSAQGGAWGTMTSQHGMIGLGHYNPLAMFMGTEADWLDHQLAARSVLGLNPVETVFIIEHEWGPARVQDFDLIEKILAVSVAYMFGIDQAADMLYQAQALCAEHNLPLPGTPDPRYNIPGLQEEVDKITA